MPDSSNLYDIFNLICGRALISAFSAPMYLTVTDTKRVVYSSGITVTLEIIEDQIALSVRRYRGQHIPRTRWQAIRKGLTMGLPIYHQLCTKYGLTPKFTVKTEIDLTQHPRVYIQKALWQLNMRPKQPYTDEVAKLSHRGAR